MITDPLRVFLTSKTYFLSKINEKEDKNFFHVSRTDQYYYEEREKRKTLTVEENHVTEQMKRVGSLSGSFLC